jgi:hypothetical protein
MPGRVDRPEAFGIRSVPAQRALVPLHIGVIRVVLESHHDVTVGTRVRLIPHMVLLLGGGFGWRSDSSFRKQTMRPPRNAADPIS